MIICNGYMPGKRQAARRVRGKLVKFQQNKRFFAPATAKLRRATFTNGQKTYRFSLSKNVFGRPGGPPPSHSKPYPATGAGGFANLVCLPVALKAQENVFWREKDGAARTSRHAEKAANQTFGILHFTFYYQCVIYVSKAARCAANHSPEAAKKEGRTG